MPFSFLFRTVHPNLNRQVPGPINPSDTQKATGKEIISSGEKKKNKKKRKLDSQPPPAGHFCSASETGKKSKIAHISSLFFSDLNLQPNFKGSEDISSGFFR